MPSIYNISAWANSTFYEKNAIVSYNNNYYYAKFAHTSQLSSSFNDEIDKWAGMNTDPIDSSYKPEFTWRPSYQGDADLSPRLKVIKFGDGYEQRVRDGINSTLIKLNMIFAERDIQEATAILHFLHTREGAESFLYTPTQPLNKLMRFSCKELTYSENFANSFTINAKFEQVTN